MNTSKPVKNAKNSGEVGKTAIQVVERMMNLLDAVSYTHLTLPTILRV